MFKQLKDKYNEGRKLFSYFYSGEFVDKSYDSYSAKNSSSDNRIILMLKVNYFLEFVAKKAFLTQSFSEFKKELQLIDQFKTDRWQKLVKIAVDKDSSPNWLIGGKAGELVVDREKEIDSFVRVGKQYGYQAEHAYVPPFSVPNENDFIKAKKN